MKRTIGLIELAMQALYHINTQTEETTVEFTRLVNYGVAVANNFKQIGVEACLQNFKEGMENLKEHHSFVVENKNGVVYISFAPTMQVEEIQTDELFADKEALTNLGIKPKQPKEVLLQKEKLGN